jgi:hypothetical protein
VNTGKGGDNMLPISGYVVTQVLLFFLFDYAGEDFPVALVWWYTLSDDNGNRDVDIGMWLIEHEYCNGNSSLEVVYVDTIFHVVHLLPFFEQQHVPR